MPSVSFFGHIILLWTLICGGGGTRNFWGEWGEVSLLRGLDKALGLNLGFPSKFAQGYSSWGPGEWSLYGVGIGGHKSGVSKVFGVNVWRYNRDPG